MPVIFRNYLNDKRFGSDYHKVVDFLKRINREEVTTPNFLWGRWAWMISRPVDNEEQRNLIGLWEDNGEIVAMATFELTFGEVIVCLDQKYKHLLSEIISYAKNKLAKDGKLLIIINDNDKEFQSVASKNGFRPLEDRESVAVLDLNREFNYNLPEGFRVTSMSENWDFNKYNNVMWRGFNNEGEPDQSREMIEWRKTMLSSPHLVPEITLAIVAPDGNYASHCGLWHNWGDHYAYVEPVATDPNYRGMGLGKAAVYEAVKRVKNRAASEAYVVSSQQFYYNLGFRPHVTETWWEFKR